MNKGPAIHSLRDTAGLKYPEDGLVLPDYTKGGNISGVVDSFSKPYYGEPPLVNGRISTGQKVTSLIVKTFLHSDWIHKGLIDANKRILLETSPNLISGNYAGASFAFAQTQRDHLKIIQGGDCLAIWADKSGEVSITPNKYYPFDLVTEMDYDMWLAILGDQKQARNRHMDCLIETRRLFANKPDGFSIINGDILFNSHWFEVTIPISNMKYLLLFSDGFVPFSQMGNLSSLRTNINHLLMRGYSLDDILAWTRKIQPSPTPEASAILLNFQ